MTIMTATEIQRGAGHPPVGPGVVVTSGTAVQWPVTGLDPTSSVVATVTFAITCLNVA
jgi:hypothetical protein